MADKIKLRAGNSGDAPTLEERELAYFKDEKRLVVGTDRGNVPMPSMAEVNSKLTAKKVAMQDLLTGDLDTHDLAVAFNGLIHAMKESGVMKTN